MYMWHHMSQFNIIPQGLVRRPPFNILCDLKYVGMSYLPSVHQSSLHDCTNIYGGQEVKELCPLIMICCLLVWGFGNQVMRVSRKVIIIKGNMTVNVTTVCFDYWDIQSIDPGILNVGLAEIFRQNATTVLSRV